MNQEFLLEAKLFKIAKDQHLMKSQHSALAGLLLFATLVISACGDRDSRYDTLADAKPYLKDKKYSGTLKECAIAETAIGSCSINRLPTLGMEHPNPTIANVMERVLVSDRWMGERFEQLLAALPEDILHLLGAVTVVVIDGDLRPSYYHNVTGAIYLDPANLWMTQDEKNVINRKQDHRAAYSDPMTFRSYWRYSKNNGPAFKWYGFESDEDRPFEDIIIPMASLLYHELAHANDIFPVETYGSVNRSKSIYSITEDLADNYPSTHLRKNYPLDSREMFHIAGILFQGVTPSEADTKLTATEVGSFFEPDNASDDYGYTSQFEDLAMLLEEAMMKFHFNVDRDIAYIDYPGDNRPCDEHIVAWGVRNRIGEDRVKERAQFVIEKLFPEGDYSEFFNSLPKPTKLANIGWCASEVIDNADTSINQKANFQIQSRKTTPFNADSMTRLYGIQY